MPPAKPAQKRAPKPKATCRTCGKRITIPEGWTAGSASRRHYWAKHREVMQSERGSRS
ncbi:MAG: hypothetical protein M3N53_01170 [Actinomycetota bacterium]|nr:hypothetical protein [Actinomycetota bacterium]